MNQQITDFGNALIFIIAGILFALGGLFTASLIRPKRPNEEKNTIYECGEDPVGSPWGNFNIRFYIIAIVFILFEVEVAFLFPWGTVFADKKLIDQTGGLWGWFTVFEAFAFIIILAVGLVYVWTRGFLEWDKPQVKEIKSSFEVPKNLYEEINKKFEGKK